MYIHVHVCMYTHLNPCLITMYVSKPSAALMQIFECADVSNVGNQRLSLVSMRRKTTSCDWTSISMVSTSLRAFSMALAVERGRGRERGEREGEGREGEGEGGRRERKCTCTCIYIQVRICCDLNLDFHAYKHVVKVPCLFLP